MVNPGVHTLIHEHRGVVGSTKLVPIQQAEYQSSGSDKSARMCF